MEENYSLDAIAKLTSDANKLKEVEIAQKEKQNTVPVLEASIIASKKNTQEIVESIESLKEPFQEIADSASLVKGFFEVVQQIKGKDGKQGEKGEKGDKGDQGEKGDSIQGEAGLNGFDGRDGRDGIDGKDGARGAKGDRGEQGEKGEKGEKGDNGSPDTGEDIVSKLSSIEDNDKKLSYKALKDWRKLIGGGASYLRELSDVDLGNTDPTDGYVLSWDALQKKWKAVAQTGGGGSVTVSGTYLIEQTPDNGTYEALSGSINGSNTVFTTSSAYVTGRLVVHLNGQLLLNGTDFSETSPSAGTFTLASAPTSGDVITAIYQTAGIASLTDFFTDQTPDNGTYPTLAGLINGSNALFTVSEGVYLTGKLLVYLNGQLLLNGTDFTETTPASGTFTLATAPVSGDVLTAQYLTVASGGGGAVDSVNGQTGVVVLDTDDIAEGITNQYFTNERAQDAVGSILTNTSEIVFSYNDPANTISASLSAGVQASLALANTAIQSEADTLDDVVNRGDETLLPASFGALSVTGDGVMADSAYIRLFQEDAETVASDITLVKLFGSGRGIGWVTPSGFVAELSSQLLTGYHRYNYPDIDGTIVLDSTLDGDKGDITVSAGGTVFTIDNDVVTNTKLAEVPTLTLKGNNTGSTANPSDLTVSQVQSMLGINLFPCNFFGDGSTGDLTISSGTTTLGVNSNYYNNLTVTGTGVLATANQPLFVKGTLTLSGGTIRNNGNDGANSSSSTGGATGATIAFGRWFSTTGAGTAGANGTTTNGAASGVATATTLSPNLRTTESGRSGGGGTGTGGSAGISGGGTNPLNIYYPSYPQNSPPMVLTATTTLSTISSGTGGRGGASGAGNGAVAGGGGGGGGSPAGCIYIACDTLDISSASAGAISAIGGVGGNGAGMVTLGVGGGGGGGGAMGGMVVILYRVLVGTVTNLIDTTGGNGGNGGVGGGTGGGNGSGGYAGGGGTIVVMNATSGAVTVVRDTTIAGVPSGMTGGTAVATKATL